MDVACKACIAGACSAAQMRPDVVLTWMAVVLAPAGPNATAADLHHLPFAEASLGHKPRRKQKPSSGTEEEGDSASDGDSSLADDAAYFLQQHPPTLAADQPSRVRLCVVL